MNMGCRSLSGKGGFGLPIIILLLGADRACREQENAGEK